MVLGALDGVCRVISSPVDASDVRFRQRPDHDVPGQVSLLASASGSDGARTIYSGPPNGTRNERSKEAPITLGAT